MKQLYRRAAWWAVGMGVVVVGGMFLIAVYAQGHARSPSGTIHEVARALEEEKTRTDRVAAEDTHGGRTPQETLELYRAALEQRDYAKAAAYVVTAKRQMAHERLAGLSEDARKRLIDLLGQAGDATGTYSFARDAYTVRSPILIDFIRYPSGVWKLVEL